MNTVNTCEYCGETEGRIVVSSKFSMILCEKHYGHMKKHGHILEKTTRDKNEIIIHSDYAEVITYDKNFVANGSTMISIEDVNKVRQHKVHIQESGYAMTNINGNSMGLHRLIMNLSHNDGIIVDHKDRNKLNNKRDNLRIATFAQNVENQSKTDNRSSIYKGVSWHKHKKVWYAGIKTGNRTINIGQYSTEIEAAIAYNSMAKEIQKEFAVLNTIPKEFSNIVPVKREHTRKSKYKHIHWQSHKNSWRVKLIRGGTKYIKEGFTNEDDARDYALSLYKELNMEVA